MKIKVLGTGCPKCQELEQKVKEVVEEMKLEASVEKVTDIAEIVGFGVMSTPALAVDGKVVFAGSVPEIGRIKEVLGGNNVSKEASAGGCSCGGNC